MKSILPSSQTQMSLDVVASNPEQEPQRHLYDHLPHLSVQEVKKTLKRQRSQKANIPQMNNLDLFAPPAPPKP